MAARVTCPGCGTLLEIHPDADFEGGGWHDLTHLSIAKETPVAIYEQVVRECLTDEAATRLLAGDMSATDEAGHELISDECSRIAREEAKQ
jgi:hypothetical protein